MVIIRFLLLSELQLKIMHFLLSAPFMKLY